MLQARDAAHFPGVTPALVVAVSVRDGVIVASNFGSLLGGSYAVAFSTPAVMLHNLLEYSAALCYSEVPYCSLSLLGIVFFPFKSETIVDCSVAALTSMTP